MKTEILYKNISKPFNWGTGTVIEVDGRFQEFPTEEAWEFYYERKNGC